MDYYVNMDGMKLKVVYVKDPIIGLLNKINAVSQKNILIHRNLFDIFIYIVRKGEINDSCDIDYQCHREIGLVCDEPPGVSTKRCVILVFIYYFLFELKFI
jgi:hypothetical protein